MMLFVFVCDFGFLVTMLFNWLRLLCDLWYILCGVMFVDQYDVVFENIVFHLESDVRDKMCLVRCAIDEIEMLENLLDCVCK